MLAFYYQQNEQLWIHCSQETFLVMQLQNFVPYNKVSTLCCKYNNQQFVSFGYNFKGVVVFLMGCGEGKKKTHFCYTNYLFILFILMASLLRISGYFCLFQPVVIQRTKKSKKQDSALS